MYRLVYIQVDWCVYSLFSPHLEGIWHCYREFSLLRDIPGADVTITDIGFHTDFHVYLQLSQTWLIFCE